MGHRRVLSLFYCVESSLGTCNCQTFMTELRFRRCCIDDGFNVVAIGIEYVRRIVFGIVLRTKARRAVVFAAGGERRFVEVVDSGFTRLSLVRVS